MKIKTHSYEETLEFGKTLGQFFEGGELLCLDGDLGTGKTALVNGIAKGLEIDGYITSPTFTLVNEYSGRVPLFHFDVYRISDPEEMYEIGFEEYLYSGGVVVIEWASQITEVLPKEGINIHISKCLDEGIDLRILDILFVGDKYKAIEDKLNDIYI